ncbi:MAG TPA: NUDIX hydrolase, partial [Bacillaceae bacterium]
EPGEEPAVTVKRELEEETGYAAAKMDHLISFYTSPGFADELIHLYVASGLSKVDNPLAGDEDEFVEIHELTLEEAVECIKEGSICDAKTAYAIQYLQLMERMGK